jgi:hypothetical protein
MAEEMFKARLPFVVIDPVRAWWGLRSLRDGFARKVLPAQESECLPKKGKPWPDGLARR